MKSQKPARKKPRGDSIDIHVSDANRADLIRTLAEMPDEAFSWFVMWASIGSPEGSMEQQKQAHQMFPDGLGGFQAASREAIDALRAAAKVYIERLP